MPAAASAREAFARAVLALEPYAADIVFIGGWVHELLLAECDPGARAIRTDDVDIAIPRNLPASGRPPLMQLVTEAGFDLDPMSGLEGVAPRFSMTGLHGTLIDLDLITESNNPGDSVIVEGQAGLTAQGYPGQTLLLTHSRWMSLGPSVHPSLDPSRRIRIPMVGAYVLHKGLSSSTRMVRGKAEKDLVYLYETLRHPQLGEEARAEIRAMRPIETATVNRFTDVLQEAIESNRTLRVMAQQLLTAGQSSASEADLMALIRAVLRRAIGEV